MRTTYKVKEKYLSYFITSTIVEWIPVFKVKENINALLDAIIYNQEKKDLKIFACVIMPEHFHMICHSENLVSVIQSVKSFTAKKIIEFYKKFKKYEILEKFAAGKKNYKTTSKYQIWQEGFMPKVIISEKMFYQKIEYIHNNPVKRGLVKRVEDYEFSSGVDYYTGKNGRIRLDYTQFY